MSVASSGLVNPSRGQMLTMRLAPYLVEALCELTRAVRDKTHAQTEVGGLLFGTVEESLATVDALKTFKDSGPRSDLARRERMEKAFQTAVAQAHDDSEFSNYKLLGWFSLRGSGGLINSDVEFHNRHFKNDEVALIVWREGETQVTAELYSRSESGKLTTEEYRWCSVRLSTELRRVSQPIDLTMRMKLNEDSYLRTYASGERNERREEWKKIAASAKRTLLSLLPGRGRPDEYTSGPLEPQVGAPVGNGDYGRRPSFDSRTLFRDTPQQPPQPVERPDGFAPLRPREPDRSQEPLPLGVPIALEAARAAVRRPSIPEVSGLPMVINTRRHRPRAVPWLSMAMVFILFSGVTFAVLALKGIGTGSGKLSQIMRVLFPGADLELRAEGRGDRLLLTWNRKNSVVSSASTAVLSIFDGPQHFEKRLDPAQIADGSVLYRPLSGDVTFRLQVIGTDQGIAVASLRVLDATNPATNAREAQVLDVSSPAAVPAAAPAASGQTESAMGRLGNTAPAASLPLPAAPVPTPVRNQAPATVTRTERPPARVVPAVHETRSAVVVPPQNPPPVVSQASQNQVAAPANNPPQQTTQQQPVVNTTTAQQKAVPPAAPPAQKPAPVVRPDTQRPAPPSQQAAPQTGGTAINGWDPNISENTRPQDATTGTPAADGRSLAFAGPKVLLQVMPATRSLTPGVISETTRVEVEVRIDDKGHVKAAHLASTNVKKELGSAALAAAKQWTFQPATLRGQRVESDHTIVFEFRPEGQ